MAEVKPIVPTTHLEKTIAGIGHPVSHLEKVIAQYGGGGGGGAASAASMGFGYAVCRTGAETAAKTASLSGYALSAGGLVMILFQDDVNANATLNIQNTGAKQIRYNGTKIEANVIKAGDRVLLGCQKISGGGGGGGSPQNVDYYYHVISIDRWQKDIAARPTTTEMNAKIESEIGGIVRFEYYLCGSGEYDAQTGVPTVASPDTNHIYLVPTAGTNLNMYAYISGAFTFLGTTEVDLSNYVTRADLAQAVPEKVSELENDAGYITNPKIIKIDLYVPAEEVTACETGYVGGLSDGEKAIIEVSADTAQAMIAAAASGNTLYANTVNRPLDNVSEAGEAALLYNLAETQTGAHSGLDVVDAERPVWAIIVVEDEEAPGTYVMEVLSSEKIAGKIITVFAEGSYLTEHQSLQGLATETWVNTALGNKMDLQVIDAKPISGSGNLITSGGVYKELNKKADKTAITKMVQGADKAYTIVVSNSAPASGTADNIITIVV